VLGAIAGDIIGSVYEVRNHKSTVFPLFRWDYRFTDDTVLTVAIADAILSGAGYAEKLKEYYRRYPNRGYGWRFIRWGRSESLQPYGSWGNGSAMRVSPVGWAFDTVEEVLAEAARSAAVTHDHPDAVAGAQATALAVFMARTGASKTDIRDEVRSRFGYALRHSLDEIRPHYRFEASCLGTVPPAIQAFLEADDYEDAVRKAVSLGGDSDTLTCITGGIAQAAFGLPEGIAGQAIELLDSDLAATTLTFCKRFGCLPRPAGAQTE
jgi:ADP-ribosylglycohydrolase